jgi:hypothetical protein
MHFEFNRFVGCFVVAAYVLPNLGLTSYQYNRKITCLFIRNKKKLSGGWTPDTKVYN